MTDTHELEDSGVFLRVSQTDEIVRQAIRRFSRIIGALAVAFGVVFAAVAHAFGDTRLGLFTVVVFGVAALAIRAEHLVRLDRHHDALMFIARGLIVVAVAGALTYPIWVATMCILPLLAMSMASAHARREQLPLLAIACVLGEAVVILAFFAAPMESPLPEWLAILLAVLHFSAAVVVTLYSQFVAARLLNDRVREAEAAHLRNERFIVNMSHEIRTPLTAVHGFAEVLEGTPLDAAQMRYVDNILVATRHLTHVCRELLELQRTRERGVTLQSIALSEVVEQASLMSKSVLGSRRLDVDVGELAVRANGPALKQVLINLLQNVGRHTPPHTQVRIDASLRDGFVQVRVHDNGPGMPPDQLRGLFDGFGTLSAREAGGRGAGVGLAVSLALVERMGGRMTCVSRQGNGTTFQLHLPSGEIG